MQKYTSKNTSVNTTKLPAIYNMIDWDKVKQHYHRYPCVFDYGAGRIETVEIIDKFLGEKKVPFFPYDLYNLPYEQNQKSLNSGFLTDIFICSNVICVIDDDITVQNIINNTIRASQGKFRTFNDGGPLPTYFFRIYEGDKSGIGKQTGKDQYQRNMRVKDYLTKFTWAEDTLIYKNTITNPVGKLLLGGKN